MRLRLLHKRLVRAGRVLTLCVAAFAAAAAQNADIRGVVADSATGEKIPFASVSLVNTPRGTSTNVSGFFLIPNVPPGTYEIAASSVGYIRQSRTIVVLTGQATNLNFLLSSEAVQMGEVIVTERSKRELKEIQTSVQVMDQRDMRLVPATVQDDVFRSIAILPGIVSTSDVSSQFYVRGGASDQNLILLDGMRIYNPYHALGIFSIFDTDVIQSTEVYTGAFPPGFGGRLSSVVNLVTRDGRRTGYAARANANFLSSKVQVEGPIGEHIRMLVNGRKSMPTKTFDRFLHQDAPLTFYDLFSKVTVEGSGGQSRYSASVFLSGDDILFTDASAPDYSWANKSIGFTGSGLLDDRVYVTAIAYGSNFEASRIAKPGGFDLPAKSIVKDFTVRSNATLYTDSRALFFFGFEFNFPYYEYRLVNNTGTELELSETIADISGWLRTQVTEDNFQVDGGAHFDFTTLFRGTGSTWFQPRFNASLGLFDDWRLKASYGRFTQHFITVNNEDDLIPLFDAWIAIPEGLEPERADHYVIGIGGSIAARVGVDIQAYTKRFGSIVTYNRDKVTSSDPDYTNSTGQADGIESLVRYEHPDVDVMATYALGRTTISVPGLTYAPRYDRRHSLKLLGVVHLARTWDLSIRWDYGSGLPYTASVAAYNRLTFDELLRDPRSVEIGRRYVALGSKNAERLPSFHRMDISTSYQVSLGPLRAGLGVSIINVYDRKNVFYFDRDSGRRVNSLSFFPSAMLTVEYQ